MNSLALPLAQGGNPTSPIWGSWKLLHLHLSKLKIIIVMRTDLFSRLFLPEVKMKTVFQEFWQIKEFWDQFLNIRCVGFSSSTWPSIMYVMEKSVSMVKLPPLKLLIFWTKWWQPYQIEQHNSGTRIVRPVMKLGNLWIIPALKPDTNKNNPITNSNLLSFLSII